MIPIRDDQPRFSTPFVNYFIVALNALAFFYELSIQTQGHRALDRFVYQFGVVPTHVELALAHLNLAGVFLPVLTTMFLHGSWLHIIGNMWVDRKSTRLNSSHSQISYAVFCLKKKKNPTVRCGRWVRRLPQSS